MEPANQKGAAAAAASTCTYSHLSPNSAIAKAAQSATFGVHRTVRLPRATLYQQPGPNQQQGLGAGGHCTEAGLNRHFSGPGVPVQQPARKVAAQQPAAREVTKTASEFSEFDSKERLQ
jgi:hypothetical protein